MLYSMTSYAGEYNKDKINYKVKETMKRTFAKPINIYIVVQNLV